MKPTPLVLCLVLAAGSFAFARQQHVSHWSATVPNPFNGGRNTTLGMKFFSDDFFGNWVKDQWPLAIAVPVGLIAAGAVLSMKK